ncbi:hypothetical protein JCM8097_004839 [Rhodosporidiobolus ruineniae]
MAKKQPKGAQEPTAATPVPNRDALQRINYLHQASTLLSTILAAEAAEPPRKRSRKGKERATDEPESEQARQASTSKGGADGADGEDGEGRKRKRQRQGKTTSEAVRPVSQHLARQMVEVAKKATVRMDPSVKRTKCKGCSVVLVPGVTSRVRVKPSGPHAHVIVHTCLSCQTQRRLPAPPQPSPDDTADPAPETPALPDSPPEEPADRPQKKPRPPPKKDRRARPPVFHEREGHVVIRGGGNGES